MSDAIAAPTKSNAAAGTRNPLESRLQSSASSNATDTTSTNSPKSDTSLTPLAFRRGVPWSPVGFIVWPAGISAC